MSKKVNYKYKNYKITDQKDIDINQNNKILRKENTL